MALAINRITKSVASVNVNLPGFVLGDWFVIQSAPPRQDPQNPGQYLPRTGDSEAYDDLESLFGNSVPPKYWNLVDGPPKRVVEMDQTEKDVVDAGRLGGEKVSATAKIDKRTGELIDQGFEYPPASGVFYSLSAQAQINMTNLLMIKDSPILSYPIKYNSKNDKDAIFINNAAEIAGFYQRALGTIRSILDSGTALKDLVRAATNKAELDAITDPR